MELYVSIDQQWLKDNKKLLLDKAQKDDPNEERANLYIVLEGKVDQEKVEMEIEDGHKTIRFGVSGLEFGYVDVNIPITEDLLLLMMEIVLKRINKMRTAIEAIR